MNDELRTRREDEAIEAALRRLFTPPADVRVPPELLVEAADPVRPRRRLRFVTALVASAAGLACLWLVVRNQLPEPRAELARAPAVAPTGLRPAEAPRATGAPGAPGAPGAAVAAAVADLERLYASVTRERAAMATCSGPEELEAVRSELSERCGEDVYLHPEAAGLLQGPFGSPELPGGTLLTAYPEGPLGDPSVLLAECEGEGGSWLDTGLAVGPGELRAFHARVGSIVLTEITPRSEPRLLQLFDDRR